MSNVTIENWIPLLDYAVLNGLSTSTLRRYIKAKKVAFKIEKGRYLLRSDKPTSAPAWDMTAEQQSINVFARVRELEEKLQKSNEQISELKMLVAIYEEKLAQAQRG